MQRLIESRTRSDLKVTRFMTPATDRRSWIILWVLVLFSVVVADAGNLKSQASGEKKPPPAAAEQEAFAPSCSVTAPATAQAGAAVQFQGTVSLGDAGSLAGPDLIVGNLRYAPGTGSAGFTQGTASDPCRLSDETPFTHVLTQDLAVMQTEVTRQMWADLKTVQPTLPADPTNTAYSSGMDDPVQSVTWCEAVLFANLLSVQNGLTRCYYADAGFTTPITSANYTTGPFYCNWSASGYRLPTEGEWEYFCRAGTTGTFSVDETGYNQYNCSNCYASLTGLPSVAWYCGNALDTTHPAGTKNPNPWNLRDVHGNVYEWCWDWYGTYPTGKVTDYRGAGSGSYRVARGGGLEYSAKICRSASRNGGGPATYWFSWGFRLVRTASAGGGTSWDWNFGDNTTHALTQNPGHSYTQPGIYTWKMTVTLDGQPCQQSGTITVYNRSGNFTIGGYLGVGLDAPERAVHIRGGNAVFRMDRSANTAAFMITRTGTSDSVLKSFVVGVNASGTNNGSFVINDLGTATTGAGTNRLTIDNTGVATFGQGVHATAFVTPSSRARKTDIRPLDNALGMIVDLQGVRFHWRAPDGGATVQGAGGGSGEIGFIAEDVAGSVPDVVSTLTASPHSPWTNSGKAGVFGLDYNRLTALLAEGLKQQQREIAGLGQKRDQLKALLKELRELGETPGVRRP